MLLVMRGANCHRGRAYATGHVGRVVPAATVFLLALTVTMMRAPAMPI